MGKNVKEVIDEQLIDDVLKRSSNPKPLQIKAILRKAEKKKGLTLSEVGLLCGCKEPKLIKEIFDTAWKIKQEIYGERIVLFAPLYVSDFCVNDCEYCGFHRRNNLPRRKLTLQEVREQTEILIKMGHKRLLLEFGEHPLECPIDYVVKVINEIYKVNVGPNKIRRVNVNIAATTAENYRKLKDSGIGTYQLFQETYHRPTFEKLHNGPKAEYERQLFAHNNAFAGGIDDLGIGVLFGLYDWQFEVLALVSHAQYMDKVFGVGPHTISVPRFRPAATVDFKPPYPVTEDELLKIIAILRLAVPYTGMIISTREKPETRLKAFKLGISQTSAASRVEVGGYSEKKDKSLIPDHEVQFVVNDERTLDQVVEGLLKQGLLPSFCTACYRSHRTGKDFMEIAKPGNIHNFCRPNAILTFKEYLIDFATPEVKRKGENIIQKYLGLIPSKEVANKTRERLQKLELGERDLYF